MATPEASSNSLMSVVFAKELYTLLEDCLCVFMSFVDAFARLVQVFVEPQAGAQARAQLVCCCCCWILLSH